MKNDNESAATHFFREHPRARSKIEQSSEFQRWKADNFVQIDVDQQNLFVAKGKPMVSGGDRLSDEDELMLEWARRSGLTLAESR